LSREDYDPIEFWNEKAEEWRKRRAYFRGKGAQNIRKWIDAYGQPSDKFLDVGPGNGKMYRGMGFTMDRFFMAEIAPDMARMCQEETGAPVVVWDGQDLPWVDNTFEWVMSITVMQHVKPDNIERFINEHARVSKKYVVVATSAAKKPKRSKHAHNFWHDYLRLFEAAGLSIIEERNFSELKGMQWLLRKGGT
jgi:ubiquinone/menaquinone biosynthesis C-methylase UbiE